MPTTTDECFAEQVLADIKIQLDTIALGIDAAAKFATNVVSVGSGRLELRDFDTEESRGTEVPYIRRGPDGQFQHLEAKYIGMVFELSFSQDGNDLEKKGLGIYNTLES